jgi:hypothetical protein
MIINTKKNQFFLLTIGIIFLCAISLQSASAATITTDNENEIMGEPLKLMIANSTMLEEGNFVGSNNTRSEIAITTTGKQVRLQNYALNTTTLENQTLKASPVKSRFFI